MFLRLLDIVGHGEIAAECCRWRTVSRLSKNWKLFGLKTGSGSKSPTLKETGVKTSMTGPTRPGIFKPRLLPSGLPAVIGGTLLNCVLALPLVTGLSCSPGLDPGGATPATASHGTGKAPEKNPLEYAFPADFLFGLATAPGHAEDQLEDAWAEHAKEGKIPSFDETPRPYDRLMFWSRPDIEIGLAAKTGIRLYRMGLDWQRLVPFAPGSDNCPDQPGGVCPAGIQDHAAWKRYQDVHFALLRQHGLIPMLTLFHHSAPKWFVQQGGWTNPDSVGYFSAFVESILAAMQAADLQIPFWNTLNEPSLMALMSYGLKQWPHHYDIDAFSVTQVWDYLIGTTVLADYNAANDNMIKAHLAAYELIKKYRPAEEKVGFAQNAGIYSKANPDHFILGPMEGVLVDFARNNYLYKFMDSVAGKTDFIGVNYYGEEFISVTGLAMKNDREYMDSGRSLNPTGFYRIVKDIHQRYEGRLPIYITENGISDSNDFLRPAYLLEHLAALHALMEDGVSVIGYNFWTLSDNWEWGDGYCPRFGLLAVDRNDPSLETRIPRAASHSLFTAVAKKHGFSQAQREQSWARAVSVKGQQQPFCRSSDGITPLGNPDLTQRTYVGNDWRFKRP